MGRPQKEVNEATVRGMASVGATNVEIADFVGVTEKTIRNRFSDILTKTRARVKTKLRRAQLKCAMSGNPTMLIWMGKQILDQVDKMESKNEQSIVMKGNRVDTSPKTESRTQASSTTVVSPN